MRQQHTVHHPDTDDALAPVLTSPHPGRLAAPAARIAYRIPHVRAQSPVSRTRRRRALRLAGIDAAVLLAAVVGTALGAGGIEVLGPPLWAVLQVLLTLVLMAARGSYRSRITLSPVDETGRVLAATGVAAMVVVTARVVLGGDQDADVHVVRLWVFSVVYLLAARVAVGLAVKRSARRVNTLIVGAGSIGQLVAERLASRPETGLRPIGFLDKEPRATRTSALPVLGASWDLADIVREHRVEHVVVTFSTAPHDVLLRLVRTARELGVEVSLVPRLFEEVSSRISVEHLGGVPLLRVDQADPRGWQFELKYALDRLFGVVATLALSPLLLVLALLVRVTSPGPILFRQSRVGLDGREFDILKFRTMRIAEDGAENDAAWAARVLGGGADAEDATSAPAAVALPDRRTPIGRVLRRWSLDELPQVLNIARGDMSVVGPRPERTGYVRSFEGHVYRYGDRHRVKSGLTGWAQVHGLRGETSLADRVEWDNYYVENWSPMLDVKILLMTVPAVLSGSGAE